MRMDTRIGCGHQQMIKEVQQAKQQATRQTVEVQDMGTHKSQRIHYQAEMEDDPMRG